MTPGLSTVRYQYRDLHQILVHLSKTETRGHRGFVALRDKGKELTESMQDERSVGHTMLLHAEGVEGRGRANHRRSPTEAGSPFCPHTPLAERPPKRERDRKREKGSECEKRKMSVKVKFYRLPNKKG